MTHYLIPGSTIGPQELALVQLDVLADMAATRRARALGAERLSPAHFSDPDKREVFGVLASSTDFRAMPCVPHLRDLCALVWDSAISPTLTTKRHDVLEVERRRRELGDALAKAHHDLVRGADVHAVVADLEDTLR